MVELTEVDVEVNGITLHCTCWGRFSSPDRAVLFVHGITSNGRAWAAVGPALAEAGWYVVAPDLRGRGRSSKPPHGYSVPHHADDLLGLCDSLGLERVPVIGHSLGAQISLYLAGIYPERVERLGLVDAGGTFPADTLEAIGASVKRLDSVYPSLDAYLETMRASPIHPWNDFWQRYYTYDAEVRAGGTAVSRVPRRAVDEEVRVLLTVLYLDRLPEKVRVPTLIVRATLGLLGPNRGLVLPSEQAKWLADTIADSRVVEVPGTNHYTILLANELRQAVLDFLPSRCGE